MYEECLKAQPGNRRFSTWADTAPIQIQIQIQIQIMFSSLCASTMKCYEMSDALS